MTLTRGRLLLAWAAIGLVWLVSFGAWTTAVPPQTGPPAVSLTAPAAGVALDTAGLRSSAALIRDRDPFRLERKPTAIRYDPWEPTSVSAAPIPPAAPRPLLVLVGIVGGPLWHAVIEGIPGRETGMLLGVGEDAAGIRLIRITGDTAVLRGLDTTWVLTPKRAWQ